MRELFHLMNPWWSGLTFDAGLDRPRFMHKINKLVHDPSVVLLVGPRRVGKTYLLRQTVQALLGSGIDAKRVLFLLGDHPVIGTTPLADLLREYRAIHGLAREEQVFLFVDEVQAVQSFDLQVKNIYDLEKVKIFLSGSSAGVFRNRGAHLTGRMIEVEVFPLDFAEFLSFRGARISERDPHLRLTRFEEYLRVGGYPEYVLRGNPEYLPALLKSTVYRDIVSIHSIKYPSVMDDLLVSMANRLGSKTSYTKLKNVLRVTVDTVRDYLHFLEEAFILQRVEKFSPSVNERIYSEAKYYFFDAGMRNALTGYRDEGAVAENVCFQVLRGSRAEVFYFFDRDKEVDFVIKTPDGPLPVEAKYVDRIGMEDDRLAGLRSFIHKHHPPRAFVATRGFESRETFEGCKVRFVPLWDFSIS
jgi:predicted AAA+ superfamily ATPase